MSWDLGGTLKRFDRYDGGGDVEWDSEFWVVSGGSGSSSKNVAPGDGVVSPDRVENKEADVTLS
jgi:hypothetical protein